MPSITTWTRLEPQTAPTATSPSGYAARIHDPLWLLGRQWQLGEFQGEDAGTPIVARWRGRVAPITRYAPGPIPPNTQLNAGPFDPQRAARDPGRAPAAAPVRHRRGHRRPAPRRRERPALPPPARAADDPGGPRRDHPPRLRRAAARRPASAPASTPRPLAYADLVAGRALDGRRLRAALGDPRQPAPRPRARHPLRRRRRGRGRLPRLDRLVPTRCSASPARDAAALAARPHGVRLLALHPPRRRRLRRAHPDGATSTTTARSTGTPSTSTARSTWAPPATRRARS